MKTLSLGIRALTALIVLTFVGAIEEDVLECEEAIAHLRECCGMQEPLPVCGGGCDTVQLSLVESECIQHRSCEELRAGLICSRVQALSADASTIEESETWEAVCP